MISACIIVKNEESILEECLKSIKNIGEIVVVDTGSTDKTIEIVKKHGAKLGHFKWCDDFSKARNYALSLCTGDWILTIDSDEKLESLDELKDNLDEDYDALSCKVIWDVDKKSEHRQPRVFKNHKGIHYEGRVHEYLVGAKNEKTTDLKVYYGSSPSHANDKDRTIRILKTDLDKPRNLYYLAREYYFRADYDEAIKWYDKYLSVADWKPEICDAYLMKAKCLWSLQRGEEARDACLQAIKGNPDFREALKLMGEMSWDREKKLWDRYADVASNDQVLFIRS